MDIRRFSIKKKEATLYKASAPDRPLIVLNNYAGDGSSVVKAMDRYGGLRCNLLSVGGLNWDHDMTPWLCPPLFPDDSPCTGGADEYLDLLLSEIVPMIEKNIDGKPSYMGIAGYSLAGLFALYALYKCNLFDRAASMSGSLWFPEFKEFCLSHSMMCNPEKVYLSLGDEESKSRNKVLKTVQVNTEAIAAHYRNIGLDVKWELNPGGHFKDAAVRSAKGIMEIQ